MRHGRVLALLALMLPVTVLAGCSWDDPTDEGAGSEFAIVTDRAETTQPVNGAFSVTARVIDRLGTPLAKQITVTSAKTDVVRLDSTRYVSELQETRIYAKALKADAIGTALVLSAGAVTDTVKVKVQ